MTEPYLWLKALHLISVISWMAALLYLPRLFVYHASATPGSESAETFKLMEHRLLRYIANPAMIATIIFGGALIHYVGMAGWLHAKLGLVLGLAAFHGCCARWRKDFARDANRHTQKFYRIINEVPTILMILIIILAVLKPF